LAPRCGRGFHLRGALHGLSKGASGRNLNLQRTTGSRAAGEEATQLPFLLRSNSSARFSSAPHGGRRVPSLPRVRPTARTSPENILAAYVMLASSGRGVIEPFASRPATKILHSAVSVVGRDSPDDRQQLFYLERLVQEFIRAVCEAGYAHLFVGG
jgi:hypothetical protein